MFRYNAVNTYIDEQQKDPLCNLRNWNLSYLTCEIQNPRRAITLWGKEHLRVTVLGTVSSQIIHLKIVDLSLKHNYKT